MADLYDLYDFELKVAGCTNAGKIRYISKFLKKQLNFQLLSDVSSIRVYRYGDIEVVFNKDTIEIHICVNGLRCDSIYSGSIVFPIVIHISNLSIDKILSEIYEFVSSVEKEVNATDSNIIVGKENEDV